MRSLMLVVATATTLAAQGSGIRLEHRTTIEGLGRCITHSERHLWCVTRLAFSPDGKFLAAWGKGGYQALELEDGTIISVPGVVSAASGEAGSEFWLLGGNSLRRWNAGHHVFIEEIAIPSDWSVQIKGSSCANIGFGRSRSYEDFRSLDGMRFAIGKLKKPRCFDAGILDARSDSFRMASEDRVHGLSPTLETVQVDYHHAMPQLAIALASMGGGCGMAQMSTKFRGALVVFDGEGGRLHQEVAVPGINTVRYSPGGGRLAFGDEEGTLRVLDTRQFDLLASIPDVDGRWLAFLDEDTILSHDGERLATVRFPHLTLAQAWGRPVSGIEAAALSQDRQLLALSDGQSVHVFDVVRD